VATIKNPWLSLTLSFQGCLENERLIEIDGIFSPNLLELGFGFSFDIV